jgi:hypothetical protein
MYSKVGETKRGRGEEEERRKEGGGGREEEGQKKSEKNWQRVELKTSHLYNHPTISLLPSLLQTHFLTPLMTPYTPGCPRPMLTSKYTLEGVTNRPAIEAVLELIRLSKPFPETKLPGSVVRQREIVAELEEEFQQSAVNQVTVTAVCLSA